MLFDTHAHYNEKRFSRDREQAIKDALDAGVDTILNVSYDLQSAKDSIDLSKKFNFIYASVGVHPHYASKLTDESMDKIRKLAMQNKVVAIGETGLDYYRNLSPKEIQKKWFVKHIHLAKELNKPIIIHARDSYKDIADIIIENKASEVGGVIHCFLSNVSDAKVFLENNFHIAIGGPVTYRNARNLEAVIKYVPEDRLLIETDCPYLTPEPFRGKRNESKFIKLIAERIAEIKEISLEEVAIMTNKNGKKLFAI